MTDLGRAQILRTQVENSRSSGNENHPHSALERDVTRRCMQKKKIHICAVWREAQIRDHAAQKVVPRSSDSYENDRTGRRIVVEDLTQSSELNCQNLIETLREDRMKE